MPIYLLRNALLQRFNLQRQNPRIVPTQCQIPAHKPEARVAAPSPDRPHFALLVKAPDTAHPIGNFVAQDLPRLRPHILVSRREDNLIRLQLRSVGELQSMRQHLRDLLALLDLDLAVDDQLAGPNVNVVAASALEVLEEETRVIGPVVQLEPGLRQPFQRLLVALVLQRGHLDLLRFQDLRRDAPQQEIGVVDWRAVLVVETLQPDLSDGLGRDDARRTALHHRHVVPFLVEVLRDVVARVARADDDGLLAFGVRSGAREFGAVAEPVALEALHPLDGGEVLLPRVAGCQNDVTWMHSAGLRRAVVFLSLQGDRPLFLALVPGGGRQSGADPDIQLEQFGVRLEEFGQFVLRGEDGPCRWERDVGHVVVPDWVVQDELMVSSSPVVADAIFTIDHQRVHVEHFEAGGGSETSLAGT